MKKTALLDFAMWVKDGSAEVAKCLKSTCHEIQGGVGSRISLL